MIFVLLFLWVLLGISGSTILAKEVSWATSNEIIFLILFSYTGPICFLVAIAQIIADGVRN